MAYDLSDLKRVVEDTEKFLATPDTSIKEVEDRINDLTNVLTAYQNTHNTLAENNKNEFNALVAKTQEVANDLDKRVNDLSKSISDLSSMSEDEIKQLTDKIANLKELSDNIDVAVVDAVDAVADEVNSMQRVMFLNVSIDTKDGVKQVDITSLGLPDANYAVMAIPEADWMVQPIIKNKSKDSFKIGLVDRRYFANYEIYKDCSGDGNAVVVNCVIAYQPQKLINKVVDVDGKKTSVGN